MRTGAVKDLIGHLVRDDPVMRNRSSSLVLSVASLFALSSATWGVERSPNDLGAAPPPAPLISSNKMELTFRPVLPCRAFDTPDPVPKGGIRNYQIRGGGDFRGQGGPHGGCGVPAYATSVFVSLTAQNPNGDGVLKAGNAYLADGGVVVVNYAERTRSNGAAILSLSADGKIGVSTTAKTRIAGDVTGYFAPQIHAVLAPTGGIYDGSPRVVESVRLATGSYRVQLDINPAGCTPIPTVNGNAYFASAYVSGSYVYANTYLPGGTPVDVYWALYVAC